MRRHRLLHSPSERPTCNAGERDSQKSAGETGKSWDVKRKGSRQSWLSSTSMCRACLFFSRNCVSGLDTGKAPRRITSSGARESASSSSRMKVS